MAKDFSGRTISAQAASNISAGTKMQFRHLSGSMDNVQITPSGGYVLHAVVVNNKGSSGAITVKCGGDIIAILSPDSAREFKYSCYLYDSLTISITDSSQDVTVLYARTKAN